MVCGKCKKGGSGSGWEGGQGGCEPRIELIVKMQKRKVGGGGGGGGMNEELKVL